MLSSREREFLTDVKAFREDYRRAGRSRILRITEECYVRGKLDAKYGSRYVTVLRNRIRRRVSTALGDLFDVATVDADDPIVGTLPLRPLLPDGFERTLIDVIKEHMKRSDFRTSLAVRSLATELQVIAEELDFKAE
jgi:hypothetical protein